MKNIVIIGAGTGTYPEKLPGFRFWLKMVMSKSIPGLWRPPLRMYLPSVM